MPPITQHTYQCGLMGVLIIHLMSSHLIWTGQCPPSSVHTRMRRMLWTRHQDSGADPWRVTLNITLYLHCLLKITSSTKPDVMQCCQRRTEQQKRQHAETRKWCIALFTPAPLTWRTRQVLALDVVKDRMQPIPCSRGVSLHNVAAMLLLW